MCERLGLKFALIVTSLAMVGAIAAAAEPTSKPTSMPTTRRVSNAGKMVDGWMSTIALDELKKASETGAYAELATEIRNLCLARLTCGCLDDLSGLNDMVYVLHAAQYLPKAVALGADGAAMAKMLVEKRDFSRLLFRAIPDDVGANLAMKNLLAVWTAEPKGVAEYPSFTVAAVLVIPLKEPNGCTLVDAFQWYTSGKVGARGEFKNLPYELAQYVADSRLSIPERQWAAQNYLSRPNPVAVFFELKGFTIPVVTVANMGHAGPATPMLPPGVKKEAPALAYTLPNLLKMTDLETSDQAYFASEVCKAVGVPAATVKGVGTAVSFGSVWVDSVKVSPNGKQFVWDDTSGRFPFAKKFAGTVMEPLTDDTIPDTEMMLASAAAQLPLDRREEGACTVDLARMVALAEPNNTAPYFETVDKLAGAYNERFGKNARVDPKTAHGDKRLGADLADDLLAAGLDRNLVHRESWREIIKLQKSGYLPADHVDRYLSILMGKTFADFPDYSAALLLKIIPAISDPAMREQAYMKAFAIYPRRQDLQGAVLLAQGDDYRQQAKTRTNQFAPDPDAGKGDDTANKKADVAAAQKRQAFIDKLNDLAYKKYMQAAELCINTVPVAMPAADRMEKMLIEQHHPEMVLDLYKGLFAKTSKSKDEIEYHGWIYWGGSPHYLLGQKLVQLLQDNNKASEATSLQNRLDHW